MNIIQINAQVRWNYFRGRGGAWVAVCDPLGVTAEGATVEDLNDSIHEIMQHMFGALMKEGALDAFLRKRGWTKHVRFLRDARA
jgi:predicted RNase H-like HicB family nuclease